MENYTDLINKEVEHKSGRKFIIIGAKFGRKYWNITARPSSLPDDKKSYVVFTISPRSFNPFTIIGEAAKEKIQLAHQIKQEIVSHKEERATQKQLSWLDMIQRDTDVPICRYERMSILLKGKYQAEVRFTNSKNKLLPILRVVPSGFYTIFGGRERLIKVNTIERLVKIGQEA